MSRTALVLLLSFLCLQACKSRKAVVKSEIPQATGPAISTNQVDLLKAIRSMETDFSYYNARGSMTYTDPNESHELDVNIIMEKHKYIYMNVTALLGINVARVWITRDSISILDILHRKHIVTDFRYIKRMSNVEFDLAQLQNVFTGNAVFASGQQTIVDTVLNYILLNTPISQAQVQTTYYRKEDLKVTRNLISEKPAGRELRIEYNERQQMKQNSYPKDFDINIRAEKNVECKFRLFNFVFEKTKEIGFVVPKNFETVRM